MRSALPNQELVKNSNKSQGVTNGDEMGKTRIRWMKLRGSYSNCNLYRQGVMAGSSCIGGEASIMATTAAETTLAFFSLSNLQNLISAKGLARKTVHVRRVMCCVM